MPSWPLLSVFIPHWLPSTSWLAFRSPLCPSSVYHPEDKIKTPQYTGEARTSMSSSLYLLWVFQRLAHTMALWSIFLEARCLICLDSTLNLQERTSRLVLTWKMQARVLSLQVPSFPLKRLHGLFSLPSWHSHHLDFQTTADRAVFCKTLCGREQFLPVLDSCAGRVSHPATFNLSPWPWTSWHALCSSEH